MSRTPKFILLTLCIQFAFGTKLLVFPTTNPHYKLIFGFGVPVEELELENLLIGYVFKTRFRLPASVRQLLTHSAINIKGRRSIDGYEYMQSNSTVLNDDIIDSTQINSTMREDYTNEANAIPVDVEDDENRRGSGYRWAIYKGLESLGERMGLVGRACVLKSICEAAETPFHYHNGIYSEVLHILFTPSTSVDRLSMHSDNEYLHAEVLGKSGAPCDRVFKDCKKSLIDHFSDIYDITNGFFRRFVK